MNSHEWKTPLGKSECVNLPPNDVIFYICKEFDKQVYELQQTIDEMKHQHLDLTTELRSDILSWRIKYLELLEKVTYQNLLEDKPNES